MAAADVRLRVRDLAVVAAGKTLLSGVSFDLRPGSRLAIRGPSGTGKTTMLRIIAGLIDGGGGRVLLNEQTPEQVGWPRWRRQVVLLQQRPVMTDEDVVSNLQAPFEFATASGPWPEQRCRDWLARLGLPLDEIGGKPARDLSVGEQQRVALVRALSLAPPVMLLDEPTSALDPAAAQALDALIVERCEEDGLACLVVSHDAAWLDGFCTDAWAPDIGAVPTPDNAAQEAIHAGS